MILTTLTLALTMNFAPPAPVLGDTVVGPSYPTADCIVMGKPMNPEKTQVFEVEGREVRTCCKKCKAAVEKDPQKWLTKLDAAVIERDMKNYPLDTCPMMGKELDPKKAVDVVANNRLVRVCCKRCAAAVKKNPAKAFAKLDAAAVEKQLKNYPLENCAVNKDGKLGSMGEPVNYLHGYTLIRLCCKGCVKEVDKDPAKYVAKVTHASKEGKGEHKGEHDGEHKGDGEHGKKSGHGEKKGHGEHKGGN